MTKKNAVATTAPTAGDVVGTTADRGTHNSGELSRYSTTERDQLRALMNAGDASDADLDVLGIVSARSGLDPFTKEIYIVGRKTKTGGYRGEPERWETRWTVQAGIDGFRKVTQRYAKSEGQSHKISAPVYLDEDGNEKRVWLKKWGNPAAAIVEVSVGESVGVGIAPWDEFVQTTKNGQPNSMWSKMPATMLAKCAEAQAHRKVCSLTSGMYEPAEMGQADNPAPVQMTATRVNNPRGATGLMAALEAKPTEQPAQDETVEAISLADATEAINNVEEIDMLQNTLESFRPHVTEAEYAELSDTARARWHSLNGATDE